MEYIYATNIEDLKEQHDGPKTSASIVYGELIVKPSVFIAALEDNIEVGSLISSTMKIRDSECTLIDTIESKKDKSEHRCGSNMMSILAIEVLKKGHKKIILYSTKSAKPFYRKLGFHEYTCISNIEENKSTLTMFHQSPEELLENIYMQSLMKEKHPVTDAIIKRIEDFYQERRKARHLKIRNNDSDLDSYGFLLGS